jgi:hypothetical protein
MGLTGAGLQRRLWDMVQPWGPGRHRVFIPQALGADEFLRVTWHEEDRIVVFSQWVGDTCVSAIPVKISDASELAELLVSAVGEVVRSVDGTSPEPSVIPLPPSLPESA